MTLAQWLTFANLLLIVGGGLGGWIVLRSSIAKAEETVQTRVRDALSAENDLLRNRIHDVEAMNRQQGRIIHLIITTLKKTHGIELDIDESVITLRSPNGNISRVSTEAS